MLAILFAIGLAFAIETNSVSQTAYYQHPTLGWQSVEVGLECQPQAGINCTINGFQLYKDQTATMPLRKLIP